jgi:hypothetical protein
MRTHRVALVVVVLVLLAAPVAAHVPSFPENNNSPDDAVAVTDPVKSWSFYDSLDEGEVKYYRVTLESGERLRVGTFTPRADQFTPSLVVMSSSVNGSGSVPPGVTVPEGMEATVVEGERPDTASYEPFSPSANYHTANVDRRVETETTFVIAIYEPENRTGPAGVAIGYTEAFSVTEFVTVPFDLVSTHLWQNQHPLLVIGPFLLTMLAGIAFLRHRWRDNWAPKSLRIPLSIAGLLIVATGVNTAVQMGLALAETGPTPGALVTAMFVIIPLSAGGWVLRLALQADFRLTMQRRIGLGIAGGLALLTWAGFLVGPAVLLGAAVMPNGFLTE